METEGDKSRPGVTRTEAESGRNSSQPPTTPTELPLRQPAAAKNHRREANTSLMAVWRKKVVFRARRAWAALSGRILGARKTGQSPLPRPSLTESPSLLAD
jgi:hypothetical protein